MGAEQKEGGPEGDSDHTLLKRRGVILLTHKLEPNRQGNEKKYVHLQRLKKG